MTEASVVIHHLKNTGFLVDPTGKGDRERHWTWGSDYGDDLLKLQGRVYPVLYITRRSNGFRNLQEKKYRCWGNSNAH